MFVLKKLISPFLMPPGIFVLILAILGFRAWKKKNQGLCATYACLTLALWIASSAPAGHWIISKLEAGYSMSPIPDGDVIIMLGGGVYSKSPDMSGIGAPAGDTMERLVTALRLHRRTGAPILLTGGSVFPGTASSARVAARVLKDLGVAPQDLILEEQSRDTYENALYSARICRQKGFEKPIVLTSAMHLRRGMLCFKAVGLDVTAYPSVVTTWPNQSFHWTAYLPGHHWMDAISSALHEWIGLFYYRLRY